jgi:hypothetical protein
MVVGKYLLRMVRYYVRTIGEIIIFVSMAEEEEGPPVPIGAADDDDGPPPTTTAVPPTMTTTTTTATTATTAAMMPPPLEPRPMPDQTTSPETTARNDNAGGDTRRFECAICYGEPTIRGNFDVAVVFLFLFL